MPANFSTPCSRRIPTEDCRTQAQCNLWERKGSMSSAQFPWSWSCENVSFDWDSRSSSNASSFVFSSYFLHSQAGLFSVALLISVSPSPLYYCRSLYDQAPPLVLSLQPAPSRIRLELTLFPLSPARNRPHFSSSKKEEVPYSTLALEEDAKRCLASTHSLRPWRLNSVTIWEYYWSSRLSLQLDSTFPDC